MRNFLMVAILAIVSLFGASAVNAQGTLANNSEVYVGYQFVRQNAELDVPSFSFDSPRDSHGANVSATGYFSKFTGLTGEVGANFNNEGPDRSLVTGMAGLTLKARNANIVQPFVRGLVGVASQKVEGVDNDTGLSFAAGAGLDVKVGKTVSLRLIQADYLQTRLFGNVQHNVRVGAGVVF
jgi:hypothetical protein